MNHPFFRAVFRHFFQIGGIMPSSSFAARKVANELPKGVKVIVEYGPGTGNITREMLKRIPGDGRIYAVDVNPEFIDFVKMVGDARVKAEVGDVLEFADKIRKLEPDGVDAIVSGIPLSFLDDPSRDALFKQTKLSLKPGGKFIVYQNSPEAWWLMKKHFPGATYRLEVRNIPPYFILIGST